MSQNDYYAKFSVLSPCFFGFFQTSLSPLAIVENFTIFFNLSHKCKFCCGRRNPQIYLEMSSKVKTTSNMKMTWNMKTTLNMIWTWNRKTTLNWRNQTYKTMNTKLTKKYQTKPSKVTKAKPQNSIHKPNWQIQNMLVNQSK